MKINFHFFVVLFIAVVAILCDLLIYITKIDYGIALCLSAFICTIVTILFFKKKSIKITFDYEKKDIFIFIAFILLIIVQSFLKPDFPYDVKSYHIYLQENAFADKLNFDFFPGRIFCVFLFPLGDRMHYIFRYLLGYRLGTVFSSYILVVIYYQVKRILENLSNNKKSKSLFAYGILTIFVLSDFYGSYQIDNLGLVFLLELFYITFFKDDLIKNKKLLFFAIFLSGISIGIKVSNAFFVAILVLYGIIKNRKDLKTLRIRDLLISLFLILIPYIVYLYDNYKQTGSPLFPYYNSIFKSEYFGLYNWKDLRFTQKNIFFDSILWPLNAFLIQLDYGHNKAQDITREVCLAVYYIFTYFYTISSIIRKKVKSKLFNLSILSIICTFIWIYLLQGYVRYGLIVWCMYLFVFIGYLINFLEKRNTFKEKIKKFFTKYNINYKKLCTYVYYLTIFSLIISGIVLSKEAIDSGNAKHIIGDRRTENNIISINGVWGTISDDGITENSAYPALVREKDTPIYNLDKKTFSSSEKTLEMFYEKVKNNDIYVIFDNYKEDLEENEYVITLKKLNYEIVNIEKIYTADEISYIDAKTVWVLAKVKYIGD